MVEELATPLPEDWFSATLLFPKLMPPGTSLVPLASTIYGNGYGGSSIVTAGIGYRVGETMGEDDVEADYRGSSLGQVVDSLGMETVWPICPPTIGFKGAVIDTSDSDIGRGGLGGEKLV